MLTVTGRVSSFQARSRSLAYAARTQKVSFPVIRAPAGAQHWRGVCRYREDGKKDSDGVVAENDTEHKPKVIEENMPGYHHESREDLEKKGAVVREEIGRPKKSPASDASAAKSQGSTHTRKTNPNNGSNSAADSATGPGWTMHS